MGSQYPSDPRMPVHNPDTFERGVDSQGGFQGTFGNGGGYEGDRAWDNTPAFSQTVAPPQGSGGGLFSGLLRMLTGG